MIYKPRPPLPSWWELLWYRFFVRLESDTPDADRLIRQALGE